MSTSNESTTGGGLVNTTSLPSSSSKSLFPRFATIQDYVSKLGGKRAVKRVLIANNGIAAVKAIRSIRRWAYETFGNEREVSIHSLSDTENISYSHHSFTPPAPNGCWGVHTSSTFGKEWNNIFQMYFFLSYIPFE